MITRLFHTMSLLSGLTLSFVAACGGALEGSDSADLQAADEDVHQAEGSDDQDPGCPVDLICKLCDDGSCATPNVEMLDGKCGPVTFSCESDAPGETPPAAANPPTTPPDLDCPVPAICQVCDDGSCATAKATIVDGACGPVVFSCESRDEGSAASTDGNAGSGSTGSAASPPNAGCDVPAICQVCDDGSCARPQVEWIDGRCGPITYSCEASLPPTSSAGDPGNGG